MKVIYRNKVLLQLILIAMFAYFDVHCMAQGLTISSFSSTIEPMTVPMQKKDLNEQVCALVKVHLPISGVKFQGNIIDVDFDVNEYLVYLSQNSKMMEIKCPGFNPLKVNFADFNIPYVVSKSIYILEIQVGTTEEEQLYSQAKEAFRSGKYKKAEELSNIGIKQGYKKCNEIYMYLIASGYYDKDIRKKEIIMNQLHNYTQSVKHNNEDNLSDSLSRKQSINSIIWLNALKEVLEIEEGKLEQPLNYEDTLDNKQLEKDIKGMRLKIIEDEIKRYNQLIEKERLKNTTITFGIG